MVSDSDEYNASKIIVLEGAQGIRKRPAMYIGSTGALGTLHLLYEIIDNSVDEALAGFCKNITVHLYQDDTGDIAEVTDDGRGIPTGIIPKYNKNALEIIMTTLHKGAKFNDEVYKVSGGLHGVGLTVVNALSEFTKVTSKRNGNVYRQLFSKGVPASELEVLGQTKDTGTTVEFKPDLSIFHPQTFDSTILKEHLMNTSFLNKGLKIRLIDDRFGQHEEETYLSENGLEDFISFINKNATPLTSIIHSKKSTDSVIIEYALQYSTSYEEKLESFVNSIKTLDGGTHVFGFHTALTRAISAYISKNKLSERNGVKVTGEDVREGLSAVIAIFMQNPEFEGQTKEKLGNTYIRNVVDSEVYSTLSRYLEEHPHDAKMIIEKASNTALARESAQKAKELVRKKNLLESSVLPGKLADCIDDDPENTEIFIVEGESAGGSSKQGRDKHTQAILPLKGKILNVEKASFNKIFENEEIKSMITAFGTGINETFNPENVRYKKIIIMTDADVDGSHIRTLLLTFLYRYMRKLLELGYVYIAQPPLYKLSINKEIAYLYSEEELSKKLYTSGGNPAIQRYKGLGEMNPEQLWETTMDPQKRRLKKVNIRDAQTADTLFSILMGIDAAQRRKFLHDHSEEANFLDI